MSHSSAQTQPADPHDTIRSDADERPTLPQVQLSPLAKAALACGVAFDDVYEYESARARGAL